ncbi:MAG: hypothetical protein UX91_C0015G0019 [Candidatus Amesbacteria bacterium GW2011_GWB1_47_19]|nr:MAG: hypothetical protein UX91_C0015G0019 [Candidatus Amesbacteria bacterium GW2011_GWB1_47_19]
MTDERCKKIMEELGMPDSHSLKGALEQVANETEQQVRAELEPKIILSGRKLWHYKVSLYAFQRSIYQNEFVSEQVDVVCENEKYIIVKDWYFSRIHKEKCSYDTSLGEYDINIRRAGDILEAGVFYVQYSETPVKAGVIRNRIKKKVADTYGWMADIDLSIIKGE